MSGTGFALDVTMPRRRRFSPRDLFAQGAGAWYDPSDLGSMAQNSDGSGPAAVDAPVGWIRDKSGGGRHAVQPVAGLRPMLRQAGSLLYLSFDGTDDFLSCPFALSAYPLTLMAAGRVTGGTIGAMVALGGSDTLYKSLSGGGPTAAHAIDRNAFNLAVSATISATTDQVMIAEFGGTQFSIQINKQAAASVSHGNAFGAITTLYLGKGRPSGLLCGHRLYQALAIAAPFNAASKASALSYFASKAGAIL